jgi:hypothetical protein
MLSDRTKEEWLELCRQAVHEEDPNKLMALIAEIDRVWRLGSGNWQQIEAARRALKSLSFAYYLPISHWPRRSAQPCRCRYQLARTDIPQPCL